MHRTRLSFLATLRRASLLPSLIIAFAFCYVVSVDLLSGDAVSRWHSAEDNRHQQALHGLERLQSRDPGHGWRSGYDERFAGCVPVASWPGGRLSPTVVVVHRSGRPSRMSFEEAYSRGHNSRRPDDVWVIGACS